MSQAYLPVEQVESPLAEGVVACTLLAAVFPDLFEAPAADATAEAQEASIWYVHRMEGVRLRTASGSVLHCELEFTLLYRSLEEAHTGEIWPLATRSSSDSKFAFRVHLSRSLLTAADARAARAFLTPVQASAAAEAETAPALLAEVLGWYAGLVRDFGSFGEDVSCGAGG